MRTVRLLTLFFICTALVFNSCVTNRELTYLQGHADSTGKPFTKLAYPKQDMIITPGDELYINVNSLDENSQLFNSTGSAIMTNQDVTLRSYTVELDGTISLPYIGKIKVEGLDMFGAQQLIQSSLQGYLNQPSVFIKFVEKRITVLGEVANPGIFTYAKKDLNIFQAIGYAGDATPYANRKEVLVIREEGDFVNRNYLDLTDPSTLESEYFRLESEDIVYVQPMDKRIWGLEQFPFQLVLSSVTTFILVLSFIQ